MTGSTIIMAYESYKADDQNVVSTRVKVTDLLKKFHSDNSLVTVEPWFTSYYGASIKKIWNKQIIASPNSTNQKNLDDITNEGRWDWKWRSVFGNLCLIL